MITVLLTGGVGNQMFQYAAAKALSEKLGTDLRLDISLLNFRSKKRTPRNYELDIFKLDDNQSVFSSKLKAWFFLKVYPLFSNTSLEGLIKRCFLIFKDKKTYNFDSNFLDLNGNCNLFGHFQSEKYFSGYENLIRENFLFNRELSEENKAISKAIKATTAISVHVRLGDYITNKNASENYISCSPDYYRKAIAYISERVTNPVFYIFSDEPEVARQKIDVQDAVYIDWNNGDNSYNDMYLMSLCKHNIIANSSFSWWGAWLNNYSDKIVIAPQLWFRNKEKNENIKDLIPSQWIRI